MFKLFGRFTLMQACLVPYPMLLPKLTTQHFDHQHLCTVGNFQLPQVEALLCRSSQRIIQI